ncbi:hypothetical protein [Candidatus Enterococcus murrayae]|uniref:TMhelix containing protein n=1 Tax=Candidatus Enterococcus murrayae TaxID=2815321 RepID=A0ABS3HBG1_9ENTE|nr:hypothetical protein [Enterococcus sp. MJM16]MBO0450785.1 hypothetical protein [Enterococcus sp. MJM16]
MKRINFQATLLSMVAIPAFTLINVWFAYAYICLFLLSIGWEGKRRTLRGDE